MPAAGVAHLNGRLLALVKIESGFAARTASLRSLRTLREQISSSLAPSFFSAPLREPSSLSTLANAATLR